jgi:hypothetical protein
MLFHPFSRQLSRVRCRLRSEPRQRAQSTESLGRHDGDRPTSDNRDVTEREIAGRSYARVYRTSGKAALHGFLLRAVERCGGNVIYASDHTRAPVFVGAEFGDERMGLLVYLFRATRNEIRNRPADEHRMQVRYGSETSWRGAHRLGIDVAGVDTTLVIGVHLEAGIFVGLDPALYDPLPMGISVEFKHSEVVAVKRRGWHAWERVNRRGARRSRSRSESGVETLIGFTPDRLEQFIRLEREATSLALDPVLRLRAAQAIVRRKRTTSARHALEETFHLTSQDLLEIIANRKRLTVAVRGGVAEHHLLKALESDKSILGVRPVDADGPPDVIAILGRGRRVRVECKNGEERKYKNGDGRVELQKTRASKGNPASRYYEPGQFDVLAVCLWPPTGPPKFVYRNTRDLPRHADFPDRLAVMHHIDATWSQRLEDAT